jgi:hypothetical protein
VRLWAHSRETAKESGLNNDICTLCGHHLSHHPAGPQGEDGKQFGCGLTRAELKEAGVGIFDDCQGCGHKFGFHPAGPQGEGRSSCQLIHHRCCDLKLSLISSHHLVRVFL